MDEKMNEFVEIKQDAAGAIMLLEWLEDGLKKFDRLGLKFVEGMIFASLDLHRSNEVRLWALRYAKERLRDQDQQPRSSQDDSPC